MNGDKCYIIANGLIFKAEMLDCPEADQLARINKHQYAEGLIREHGNSVFHTNSVGFIRRTRIRKIEAES